MREWMATNLGSAEGLPLLPPKTLWGSLGKRCFCSKALLKPAFIAKRTAALQKYLTTLCGIPSVWQYPGMYDFLFGKSSASEVAWPAAYLPHRQALATATSNSSSPTSTGRGIVAAPAQGDLENITRDDKDEQDAISDRRRSSMSSSSSSSGRRGSWGGLSAILGLNGRESEPPAPLQSAMGYLTPQTAASHAERLEGAKKRLAAKELDNKLFLGHEHGRRAGEAGRLGPGLPGGWEVVPGEGPPEGPSPWPVGQPAPPPHPSS